MLAEAPHGGGVTSTRTMWRGGREARGAGFMRGARIRKHGGSERRGDPCLDGNLLAFWERKGQGQEAAIFPKGFGPPTEGSSQGGKKGKKDEKAKTPRSLLFGGVARGSWSATDSKKSGRRLSKMNDWGRMPGPAPMKRRSKKFSDSSKMRGREKEGEGTSLAKATMNKRRGKGQK